jgi:hypothetical protein
MFRLRPWPAHKDDVDRRVLVLKKGNYARAEQTLSLTYRDGYFTFDTDTGPDASVVKARRVPNRLARAALNCIDGIAKDGAVVPFRELFDQLQLQGHHVVTIRVCESPCSELSVN